MGHGLLNPKIVFQFPSRLGVKKLFFNPETSRSALQYPVGGGGYYLAGKSTVLYSRLSISIQSSG
jgi:hypothetical protein